MAAVFIEIIFSDLRFRKISNRQNLLVFMGVLLCSFFYDFDLHFKYAFIFLIVGITLFYLNIIGGGDVKLIFSLMLILKEDQIFIFFMFVTLIGALLAIYSLVMANFKNDKSYIENGVAYGVAIILGFVLVIIQNL